MGNDRLNSADRSAENPMLAGIDSDSHLVDMAWRQIVTMHRDDHQPSSGAETGAFRAHPLPPDSFVGYRILREIHRGGQGIVYEAIQESTDRTVAIKVLKQGPFADGAELARFEREVHVLSRLNHPNIVTIHDRGSSAGHAYLVMDYVHGRELDQYLAGADCSQEVTLRLFVMICEAVHAAHLRGIIHRDLKPGNIRIDESGEPHVLDFGLAKVTGADCEDSSAQSMTLTGQFVGSMPWASPEQALGQAHDIDLRTDVYSLGVILYQMLTRRFPYPVTGAARDVQDRILNAVPVRPGAVVPNIDSDLDTIVLKCLAKQPDRRYQSAGELARDIRHFLAGEPIEAKRDSFVYVLRKQLGRHKASTAAGVAFVALIVGGLAYCAAQWRRADHEAGLARKAEQETKRRADELGQTAKFQQTQLADIDPKSMGMRIRSDLLKKSRAAAEKSKLSPAQIEARIAELEKSLAGADLTGIALGALDDNFFRPARAAIDRQFANQPLVKAQLLQTLASTLQEVGLLEAASSPQEEALAIRRRELGDEHPDTLISISELGGLLLARGKLEEAGQYYREALEKQRRVLGEEHPETLSTIGKMGLLLKVQGKFAEAEQYHREALDKRRRVLGDEHLDLLISIGHMGSLLREQGKLSEAEPYCREAMEKYRRILGADHHDTIASTNNMGALLYDQGKFEEAEPYFRQVVESCRRVFGEEHPDTLSTITNLANLLSSQGKQAEAEGDYREVLEKSRRILGDEHPATLAALNNVGGALLGQDRLAEAEPYYREALEKQRRLLGDEHPNTLLTINSIGSLLHAQGKLAAAEPYYQEALETRRRVLGDEHPRTLISILNMGRLFLAQGKPTKTMSLLAPAESAARRAFTGDYVLNLGRFLSALGRARTNIAEFDMAEANLTEAQTILSKAKRARERDRIDLLTGLVTLYDARQAAEPNKDYDAKAAELRAKLEAWQASSQPARQEP